MTTDQDFDLFFSLKDRATNRFVRASVYRKGRFVGFVSMAHVADGLFHGLFTHNRIYGPYVAHFLVFTDEAFTTLDPLHESASMRFVVRRP